MSIFHSGWWLFLAVFGRLKVAFSCRCEAYWLAHCLPLGFDPIQFCDSPFSFSRQFCVGFFFSLFVANLALVFVCLFFSLSPIFVLISEHIGHEHIMGLARCVCFVCCAIYWVCRLIDALKCNQIGPITANFFFFGKPSIMMVSIHKICEKLPTSVYPTWQQYEKTFDVAR